MVSSARCLFRIASLLNSPRERSFGLLQHEGCPGRGLQSALARIRRFTHCSFLELLLVSPLGSLFSEKLVVISDNFTFDKRFGLVDRTETYRNAADTKGDPRERQFPPSTRVLSSAEPSRAVLRDVMLCTVHVVGTGPLSTGQPGVSSSTERFRDFLLYMQENVGLCYCRPRLCPSTPLKFIILSRAVYHLTFST